MKEKVKLTSSRISNFFRQQRQKTSVFIQRKPFESFFIILGLLLLLIILSNVFGTPKPPETKDIDEIKSVKVFTIGSAPTLRVQAQIEKSGTIRLTALTPGVVQTIFKKQGEDFNKGETLIGMSTNYQGGNTSSLQRKLAQTQYRATLDTYPTQKELIHKQRQLAEKTDVNADDLRTITSQSLNETRDLINLNNDILSAMDQDLAELEATNVGGVNDALILSTKQLKVQFLAGNNQAKQALRLAEYNSADNKAPAELSNISKEIALKQLDIQDRMLDLNRDVSRIQLQIAQVTEQMMFPSAPFNGTVQRVFVKVGQQVSPGTELMILSENIEEDPIIAIAYVSVDIAKRVSRLQESFLYISDKITFSSYPSYVTREAIQGTLYGVYFDIPDIYAGEVPEKGFIQVDLPIGYFDSTVAAPFIPVDAVYQTKEQSYIFIVSKGVATARTVELGQVYGSYVEIKNGLQNADRVILNRNIIAGDKVTVQ